ncbi:hypothetical protein EPUS_01078 [Endocarpon pusillum Z07020]|uniref:WSC domain-containing protein n=1 Tax=Endocarpon pusillum (strain Z07020 / HMAS-L-300199) TaxID=1263415 RepID=U1FWB8_ENDPU|nr:uncharacterized protein EPUS_01078 [Endocarpon pusillum Z07020]ERF69122.1 hypothetical protein EPUS_01078 [Endocarpon pusillum Z07020]
MAFAVKALLWLVACASFTLVDAFWRMNCAIIQTGRVDPIVNPGAIASHAHKIVGPSNFGLSSTYDSLLAAPCTSCEVQKDKSAYWTPQLYYKHTNGSFQEVFASGTTVYYLSRGDNRRNIEPFPPGFRMLSGDNAARRYDNTTRTYLNDRPIADRVSFACLDKDPMKEQPYLFRTDCSNGLRAQIHFQSCWDGVNLWKPDQSHVAYMSGIDNGRCPPTHPRQFAHIFLEVLYGVNDIDKSKGGIFTFANGDATGYGFHGDFQNGWDMDVQTAALKQCMDDGSSGGISDCPPLEASRDPYFPWNCPERPPVVNENAKGMIDKLPGCNPITGYQNARAPSTNCPANLNTIPPQSKASIFNPTPGTMLGKWSYLGCAKDAGADPALTGSRFNDLKMTIEGCQAYCTDQKYPIAGLKYGRECWCGRSVSSTNPIQPPASCAATAQMICGGNSTQYCGAPNLITLWNSSAIASTQAPTTTGTGSGTGTSTTSKPTAATTSSAPANIPTAGVTTIANGQALYIGCYTEVSGGRALSGVSFSNTTGMTNDLCASYCMSRNYALFGTEYSQECYCASTLASRSTFSPQSDCSLPCKGDPSQRCGGNARLSLWNNTNYIAPRNPPTPNNQFSYIGCFTEGKTGRALGATARNTAYSKSDLTAMTVEVCASICFNKGYNWMGVEYGQECYCNQEGPINGAAVAPNGNRECNMVCKGDNKEFCGAGSRLNVYRRIGSTSTNKLVNGGRVARFVRSYQA